MLRMVQRREGLRFAREPREAIGIARERVGQDLERDVAIQLRVARAIHLPHAALADLRGDFVDAEARAGSEGQWCNYMGRDAARTGLFSINAEGEEFVVPSRPLRRNVPGRDVNYAAGPIYRPGGQVPAHAAVPRRPRGVRFRCRRETICL